MFKTTTLIIDDKMLQRLIRRQEELDRERDRMRQTAAHLQHPLAVDGHESVPIRLRSQTN